MKYVYLKFFLEKVKPKIVVGHNFNDIMFKLNDLNLNIKSIMYLHNRLYLNQITNNGQNVRNIFDNPYYINDPIQDKMLAEQNANKN